jgi:hypothetical protein
MLARAPTIMQVIDELVAGMAPPAAPIPRNEPSPFIQPFTRRMVEPELAALETREKHVPGPMTKAYRQTYCYLQGRNARIIGAPRSSNPYPAELITHAWWNEGFDGGRAP